MMQRCVAPRCRDVHAGAERGSAVPFALAALGLLLFLGSGFGVVAALVVDHRRAQSAADLAALAGAIAMQHGADGCDAAGQIAGRNGARLASCDSAGEQLTITVEVDGPQLFGHDVELSAEARAGPG